MGMEFNLMSVPDPKERIDDKEKAQQMAAEINVSHDMGDSKKGIERQTSLSEANYDTLEQAKNMSEDELGVAIKETGDALDKLQGIGKDDEMKLLVANKLQVLRDVKQKREIEKARGAVINKYPFT